jgi:hypothetical protein
VEAPRAAIPGLPIGKPPGPLLLLGGGVVGLCMPPFFGGSARSLGALVTRLVRSAIAASPRLTGSGLSPPPKVECRRLSGFRKMSSLLSSLFSSTLLCIHGGILLEEPSSSARFSSPGSVAMPGRGGSAGGRGGKEGTLGASFVSAPMNA